MLANIVEKFFWFTILFHNKKYEIFQKIQTIPSLLFSNVYVLEI